MPLLREEPARRRRHASVDGRWSSDLVRADEELVRLCEEALVAIAGDRGGALQAD